jgi:hypothetical protein
MKKILIYMLLATVSASAITLSWDLNDPAEGIQAYLIYEIKNETNYVKVATVPATSNTVVIPTLPGFHKFSCTASNQWGESPFSNTVEYRGPSSVAAYKISR